MKENEIYHVKEFNSDSPIITEINSLIYKGFKDCHNIYFQKFKFECINDIKLTNISNNEILNLTISGKSMEVYEVNKKLTVARQNGFIFNQINKRTIIVFSHSR